MADAAAPTPDADQQTVEPTATAGAQTSEASSEPAAAQEPADDLTIAPAAAAPVAATPVDVAAPAVVAEPQGPEPQVAEPAARPEVPTVAATIEVPPLESTSAAISPADAGTNQSAGAEGGEWELLVEKLRQWLSGGQLEHLWQTARTPLTVAGALIALLLVLQIYAGVLGVLDNLPLVPGLLELVGVIAVVRFGITRLVRSSDRQQVLNNLKSRWKAFRGNR